MYIKNTYHSAKRQTTQFKSGQKTSIDKIYIDAQGMQIYQRRYTDDQEVHLKKMVNI